MSIGTSKPLALSGGGGSVGPRNPLGVSVPTGTAHGYQYVFPVLANAARNGSITSRPAGEEDGEPAVELVAA